MCDIINLTNTPCNLFFNVTLFAFPVCYFIRNEQPTGYYRKSTDLTRKDAPSRVRWTAACEKAFQALKDKLCSAPVLRSPNFDNSRQTLPTVVWVPSSANGTDYSVAFFSRKVLPREVRYSTIEKECLAIKLATHAFRVYLLGRKFTIQTDHRALEWLNWLKDNNTRVNALDLRPPALRFRREVTYRKSEQCYIKRRDCRGYSSD